MAAAVLIWLCVGATKQACEAGTSPQCAYSLDNPFASSTMAGRLSPDGTLLAMGTQAGTVVTDIRTGVAVWSESSSVWVQNVAFSPDGRYLVISTRTGAEQGTKVVDLVDKVTVWDASSKPAYGVDYSPDGTKVISGRSDGSIDIHDASSGAVLKTLTGGQAGLLRRVRYSPDGTLIVTAVQGGTTAGIWDAASGNLLHSLSHGDQVWDVRVSPDSTLVASTSVDLTVVIWKTDGTKVRTLTVSAFPFYGLSLVFSRDGARLFVGVYGTIQEWDVSTGTKLSTLTVTPTKWVRDLTLSPDGSTMVSAIDATPTYLVWDFSTPAPAPPPPTPAPPTPAPVAPLRACEAGTSPQCAYSLDNPFASSTMAGRLSPDGTLLAMGTQAGTVVADIRTGVAVWSESSSVWVQNVAFSADGRYLVISTRTGAEQGTKVVDLVDKVTVWDASSKPAYGVDYSPDGTKVISGRSDGSIDIHDASSGAVLKTLTGGQAGLLRRVRYSPDGTLIVTAVRGGTTAGIWDAASGNLLHSLSHGDQVWDVRVSPDSTLVASTSVDRTVVIWKTDGTKVHTLTVAFPFYGISLVFSRDGARLFVGVYGAIQEWDVSTGTKLSTLTVTPTKWVRDLTLSPDGSTMVSALDATPTYLVWDFSTPAPPPATSAPATASPPTPAPATPSPSTRAPPTSSPETPAPPTPAPLTPAPETPTPVTPAPPTSAPETLAPPTSAPVTPAPETPAPATPAPSTCRSSPISGVCRAGASKRCTLRVIHATRVLSVAHSPSGAEVATGAADGVLRVFSTATGALLRTLGCVNFAAHDVAFSPDGVRVAAGGAGGRAVVCNATSGDLLLQLEDGGAAAAPVRRVRFSGDGRLVVAAGVQEDATRVHRVADGSLEVVVPRHAREVGFAAGGLQLATVEVQAKEATRLFAVASGAPGTEVASVGALVTSLSFAGDELARGMDDGTVRVGRWDGGDAERLRLEHGTGFVSDVQHSPDGRLLAAAGQHQVRIWAASSGAAVASLTGHLGAVTRMSFSADGTQLATVGADELLLWDVARL